MNNEEKKERIIAYLRRCRHIDNITGYQHHQGARTTFAIFSRGLHSLLIDDITASDLDATEELCFQLEKDGILEICITECAYQYYRIKEET